MHFPAHTAFPWQCAWQLYNSPIWPPLLPRVSLSSSSPAGPGRNVSLCCCCLRPSPEMERVFPFILLFAFARAPWINKAAGL